MAMLDGIAMGNRGANKLPGIRLLLRYFAELSRTFLKVIKIATLCEALEYKVEIMGAINIKDKQLSPNLDTDFFIK